MSVRICVYVCMSMCINFQLGITQLCRLYEKSVGRGGRKKENSQQLRTLAYRVLIGKLEEVKLDSLSEWD